MLKTGWTVDYKDSCGIRLGSMEELAYNATSIEWNSHQPVRVSRARQHRCYSQSNCFHSTFRLQLLPSARRRLEKYYLKVRFNFLFDGNSWFFVSLPLQNPTWVIGDCLIVWILWNFQGEDRCQLPQHWFHESQRSEGKELFIINCKTPLPQEL